MELQSSHVLSFFQYLLLGAGLAYPLIRLNIRFAPHLGLIDWPKARGVSERQIPIIGASMVVVAVVALFVVNMFYEMRPWLLTTSVLMALVGHLDDRKPISAFDKMLFQLVCATSVVLLDAQVSSYVIGSYGWPGAVMAILFIVAVTNAINFIDGIDGLAGLVIFFGAFGLVGMHTITARGDFASVLYMAAILGTILPFIYYNVVTRSGFLGNIGSYFFAYTLAVMHLSVPIESPSFISRLALSGLCFIVPIADSCVAIFSRLLTLRSPFKADKGHLHHRLVQTSVALRYVLANFMLMEMGAVAIAIVLCIYAPMTLGFGLPVIVCATFVSIIVSLILLVERATKKKLQFYFQEIDHGEGIFFLRYHIRTVANRKVTPRLMRRIEAKINAEIRVTDLCYTELPETVLVTLRTKLTQLPSISSRLENVFREEGIVESHIIEQGELVRQLKPINVSSPTLLPASTGKVSA